MTTTNKKQRLLLEYLVSSSDTFALCRSIIKSEYFDPEYRKSVDFIQEYYDEYSATPSVQQIDAQTDLQLNVQQITRDQIAYCATEIEQFCRKKAMEAAIIKSAALLEKGESDKIDVLVKEALLISLNRNMGLDYFADPIGRLQEMLEEPPRTTTGWADVDMNLGGGLSRTEMLLFSANSGGGKSIAMANMAVTYARLGLNVLYISLELSENMLAQRLDTMFTGVSTVAWRQNIQSIAGTLDDISARTGNITVKRMHVGTTANKIRAYLKEFELTMGYVPDMLIVDYLDLMGANERISADNVFEKDKQSAEQLRDIGLDYNMFIVSASQQNRTAIDAKELNQSHIAGGISKVNTVDVYISIIMTPAMKAAGEAAFQFLKTRSSDGVGKTVQLKWNNKFLSFCDRDAPKGDTVIIDKVSTAKQNLMALMED